MTTTKAPAGAKKGDPPAAKGKEPAADKKGPGAQASKPDTKKDASPANRVGMAFQANIGKDTFLVKVEQSPAGERWTVHKNGKLLAEYPSRDLAQKAALREGKPSDPKKVTWHRVDDPKPQTYAMSDADFREEIGVIATKLAEKEAKLRIHARDLEGVKGKIKKAESEREALVAQMRDLANDNRIGQGRLALGGSEGQSTPSTPKNGAVKKGAKKAPAKKAVASKSGSAAGKKPATSAKASSGAKATGKGK